MNRCWLLFVAALGAAFLPAEEPSSQMLPFYVVNNTGVSASEIFITIFGFNEPPVCNTPTSPRRQGFIAFQNPKDGIGAFTPADQATPSTTFSYQLSSFPLLSDAQEKYQFSLPYLDSGEIFFSLQAPLQLTVAMPSPPAPQFATIANPIPANPNDPNYLTVYDKMELSFEPPNAGNPPLNQVAINVTAVDFFSLPIFLTLNGANPASSGITASRSHILNSLLAAFQKTIGKSQAAWNSLIIKDKAGISVLRILSPGNGLGYSYPPGVEPQRPLYFDPLYLQDWLKNVWTGSSAYYQKSSHMLTVKTVVNQKTYYGLVNKKTRSFEFWTSPNRKGTPQVVIPLASGTEKDAIKSIFAAEAPWPKSTPANQDAYDIGRLLQAGIMTGYLPCPSTAVLSKEALVAAAGGSPSPLYTINPRLSRSLQTTGPWYDVYSAAIFPDGNGAYTWPWDDLAYLSAAPSVAKWQPDTFVEIQLGSLN